MISSSASSSRSRCAPQKLNWAAMILGLFGVLIGTNGSAQTIADHVKTIPARHIPPLRYRGECRRIRRPQ